MDDGSLLINCTGYPIKKDVSLPCFSNELDAYEREVLEMSYELPNLKMLLRVNASWRKGITSYKFRMHCFQSWISVDDVPINLNREGLQKLA